MAKSQEQKILDYMATHGSISTMQAIRNFGCTRLSARIYDLRDQGFEINAERKYDKRSKTTYCRYSLTERDIQKYNAGKEVLLAETEA